MHIQIGQNTFWVRVCNEKADEVCLLSGTLTDRGANVGSFPWVMWHRESSRTRSKMTEIDRDMFVVRVHFDCLRGEMH